MSGFAFRPGRRSSSNGAVRRGSARCWPTASTSAALAGLAAAGIEATLFAKVVADPPEAVVERCARCARTAGAELVIGIGGGSSLDGAKLAALYRTDRVPAARVCRWCWC